MNAALALLLRLQMLGWLRYLGRNLATVRGALLALVGVLVFVPWVASMLFLPRGDVGIEPDNLRRFGPALLIFYCLTNLLFSSHERALYFTPAEVQFLFSGPFTRRQVLVYKLTLTLLVSLPATLIMALVLRPRGGWFSAGLLGLLLVAVFMQLFSTTLGLIASSLSEGFYGRARKGALLLLTLAGLAAVVQARRAGADWLPDDPMVLFETTTWQVVSWPLRSFFDVMLAQSPADLPLPLAVGLAVNLLLLLIVFLMDAHYEEAAAASSARIYARMQRLRGQQVAVEGVEPSLRRRWAPPLFPSWGGVGPIFWRQLIAGLRGLGRIVLVLVIMSLAMLVPLLGAREADEEIVLPSLVILGVWLSIFLTNLVPFDFRGDIDRIAFLKTLPIVPWRLALGQLLAPTLLLTLLQWLLLGMGIVVLPGSATLLLSVAAFVPPFTFYLIALDNLLFLLFPVRVMAATPGDFQAMGRNVLLSLGKAVGLAVVGGTAGLIGGIGYLLSNDARLGILAAWPVVAVAGLVLVPLVGKAFEWFDVGRDTPA